MVKLMGKKIIAILRSYILLNWPYGKYSQFKAQKFSLIYETKSRLVLTDVGLALANTAYTPASPALVIQSLVPFSM